MFYSQGMCGDLKKKQKQKQKKTVQIHAVFCYISNI